MPYNDLPHNSNDLKLIRINTKRKDRDLIRKFSREYKKKEFLWSNQKYKCGGVMEKYVLDIKIKIINQKQL